jgi:hypothetical protein
MSPTKTENKNIKENLYIHKCFKDFIYLVENSEIINEMPSGKREFIEFELNEQLDWNWFLHVHRNQLLADAKEY